MFGKSKENNQCERKEYLKSSGGVDKGKNGVDRAATKFQVEDALERIKGLIST